jgi:hypothetical protein
MSKPTRRGFLQALAAVVAAPAVLKGDAPKPHPSSVVREFERRTGSMSFMVSVPGTRVPVMSETHHMWCAKVTNNSMMWCNCKPHTGCQCRQCVDYRRRHPEVVAYLIPASLD